MKRLLSILIALAMLCSVAAFAEEGERAFTGIGIVTTQQGEAQGVLDPEYDVTVFKGVPYAAPPVGDLRWAAAQDPEGWEGVRVFDTYADAATQPSYVAWFKSEDFKNGWGGFYKADIPANGEDCLYLNITTPATAPDANLPVIVWFHGGGYNHGWSFEPEFDAQQLAGKGAVVVTVGTRLNILGLLALPQFADENGQSGNWIVSDIAKSIEWVHNNIAAFGGDPERITVAGQSGGSGKTTVARVSPLSGPYVRGTINQSSLSAFGSYGTQEQAYEAGYALLDYLGLPHDVSAEELRTIPLETLRDAIDNAGFSGSFFLDGYSLTENPRDFYLREGQLNGKNMMAGLVFGESGAYTATTAAELYAQIREQFGDELCDKYGLESLIEITDGNVAYYNTAIKAWYGLEATRIAGEIIKKQNPDANFYTYTFGRIPQSTEWGWHSLDLWYMFGSLRPGDYENDWTVHDYATADACTSYWANFAASGNPNGYGVPEWADGTDGDFMFLDASSVCYAGTPLDPIFHEFFIQQNGLESFFAE